MKTGILLVNLGTPNSTSVKDVRLFLREFLMDPLVVDLPLLVRWVLVNLIIVPFRGPKSAIEYRKLWTEDGMPLKVHSEALTRKIKEKFQGEFEVELGMRYQNPDIRSALEKLREKGCEQLLLLPLFPQYAEATTLSVLNKIKEDLEKMNWQVKTKAIQTFATNEGFINALVDRANSINVDSIEHRVFSYHGLPERQLEKINSGCLKDNCCAEITELNNNCYRAQCFATSRVLAEKLQLTEQQYSVCFQSRLGKTPWIRPYVDDVISNLAKNGVQKIMVFSPAFVADCLETTIEIGHTYRDLFKSLGGEELYLVPGLNSSSIWVEALAKMIIKEIANG